MPSGGAGESPAENGVIDLMAALEKSVKEARMAREEASIARRGLVVREVGVGWVETAVIPKDRYRIIEREGVWSVFTFDEQSAAWDQEHGLG